YQREKSASPPIERGELRNYYTIGVGSPPYWAVVLEAAGYDPLRAQEMEEKLTEIWWERWLVDRNERVFRDNQRSKHG
ncbi:MAG: hypothetical protein WC261_08815, partial [Synergistaceae bacterium]